MTINILKSTANPNSTPLLSRYFVTAKILFSSFQTGHVDYNFPTFLAVSLQIFLELHSLQLASKRSN
jgi:hypothetical protein